MRAARHGILTAAKGLVIALAIVAGTACGSQAPEHISKLTDCAELSALFDDAGHDFDAAYATDDSDNMDRALDVQNAVVARMEELGC